MDCVIWEANSNNLQDGFHVRHPKHRNQHSSFVDPTITSKVFLLWVTIRDIEEASSKYISRLRSPYPINTESFFHQRLTGTSRSLPPSEKKFEIHLAILWPFFTPSVRTARSMVITPVKAGILKPAFTEAVTTITPIVLNQFHPFVSFALSNLSILFLWTKWFHSQVISCFIASSSF